MRVTVHGKRLAILAIVLLGITVILSVHHAQAKVYHNCSQLAVDGHVNIPRGSAYYQPQLDRNKDGIACER